MKIPNNEGKFPNKENENPQFINTQKKTFQIHDKKIEDAIPPNPFIIPNHERLFSKSKGHKKGKPVPFIMSEPHTVCDIDNTFYKVIEGRPLREFGDVKVYMRNIRDITLFKANAGYLKDQNIQLETFFVFEMDKYNRIVNLYERTKANFVQFAKESYEKAKLIQRDAEARARDVAAVVEQLEALSFEYVNLRNQLGSVIFLFETLSKYGKFLNSLSPAWWREGFDHLSDKGNCSGDSNVASTSIASINVYKTNIARFKGLQPGLFFKIPKQIMDIYDDLSRQCLNYMHIDVFTSKILTNVHSCRDYLKTEIESEIHEMEDYIQMYESNVKFMEAKEMDYKSVFEKVLFSEFQTLYSSSETTKLFTCVQYVNTRVFGGPEDPKDSVAFLMHGLEMLYIKLTSGLDDLNQEVVKAATKKLFTEDIRIMKRAHLAQRSIKECNILSKAIYTSFDPPRSV